jgi:hypothetical protein
MTDRARENGPSRNRRSLPERLGSFRPPPVQDERVPASIIPTARCPHCGRGHDNSAAFKRTLDQATSGNCQFDGLAYLIRTLYPSACWEG